MATLTRGHVHAVERKLRRFAANLPEEGSRCTGLQGLRCSQQKREIGLRMVLGAAAQIMRAMVPRHGLSLAAVGVALGLAGARGLSRLLRGVL
jgi:predicted phage tail protein